MFAQIVKINTPMIVFNMLANLFFSACLSWPLRRETIKQPLKLLLWTAICSVLSFKVSVILIFLFISSFLATISIYAMFLFSLTTSMTSSVWLNVFYYLQIVPSKSIIFVWIKRNFKAVIYCVSLFEKLLTGLTITTIVVFHICLRNQMIVLEGSNITLTADVIFGKLPSQMLYMYNGTAFITAFYFLIYLCIMLASSWATATHLSRHMRHMASNGLSCSRFRSQVRVTVTGILQGLLYILISAWMLLEYVAPEILSTPDSFMTLSSVTIINFYMMGTTVNLGVGQAVFRKRAVDLWHRIAHCLTPSNGLTEEVSHPPQIQNVP